jgi:hypothetical protein
MWKKTEPQDDVPRAFKPRRRLRHDPFRVLLLERGVYIVVPVIVIAVLVLCGFAIYYGIKQQNAWESWCKKQGGYVQHQDHTYQSGVSSNGMPIYSTDRTYFCYKDGHVIGTN